MEIVAAAAARYADASYFTVLDGIVIPRWFLEPVCAGLQAAGHRVAYAVLRAPLDVCISRATQRSEGMAADAEVITQLWSQFQELGPLEDHVVDTSGQGVDAVARTIRELMERRLLLG